MDVALPLNLYTSGGQLVASFVEGSVEGQVTLYLHRGDFENVRNIQGGTVDSPNLDISAGGAGGPDDPRGDVGYQWDNGIANRFYNGNKKLLFATNPRNDQRVHSYVPHRFHAGAFVPDGHGGWRRLT